VAELLVDTDVFVDHLRGTRRLRPGGNRISYSVITRCELYAGRGTQESAIALVLAPFQELAVNRTIAERAGRLRRENPINTPDALIAATALENDLKLMTRNLRDFSGVPDLLLVPPDSIS
jgi:hypothetical protein